MILSSQKNANTVAVFDKMKGSQDKTYHYIDCNEKLPRFFEPKIRAKKFDLF